jgi:hypothetical protein
LDLILVFLEPSLQHIDSLNNVVLHLIQSRDELLFDFWVNLPHTNLDFVLTALQPFHAVRKSLHYVYPSLKIFYVEAASLGISLKQSNCFIAVLYDLRQVVHPFFLHYFSRCGQFLFYGPS